MRIGKYITVGNYNAEITGEEEYPSHFNMIGFILAGKKRLCETSWSSDGKNVEKEKWDICR